MTGRARSYEIRLHSTEQGIFCPVDSTRKSMQVCSGCSRLRHLDLRAGLVDCEFTAKQDLTAIIEALERGGTIQSTG